MRFPQMFKKKNSYEKRIELLNNSLEIKYETEIVLLTNRNKNENEKMSLVENLTNTINILAADDNEMNLYVFKKMCQKLNVCFTRTTDGQECIEKLIENENKYDIIFMDCEMPNMDGFQATEIIKKKMEENEIREIPIIGCTGYSDENTRKKCLRVGMKDVLVKPFDVDQFKRVLKNFFETKL